jgi:hypothetical protein
MGSSIFAGPPSALGKNGGDFRAPHSTATNLIIRRRKKQQQTTYIRDVKTKRL